jgi:predicted membrane channel-forming protein YqfA (hemolysin III family)
MITESYIKETIANLRNEMTHIWGAVFIIGGGTLSLFWTEDSVGKWVTIAMGIFFTLIFLNAYLIRVADVEKITNMLLKKGGNYAK